METPGVEPLTSRGWLQILLHEATAYSNMKAGSANITSQELHINDDCRTRTCNLWFRGPTPYPLGHRAIWRMRATTTPMLAQLRNLSSLTFAAGPDCKMIRNVATWVGGSMFESRAGPCQWHARAFAPQPCSSRIAEHLWSSCMSQPDTLKVASSILARCTLQFVQHGVQCKLLL